MAKKAKLRYTILTYDASGVQLGQLQSNFPETVVGLMSGVALYRIMDNQNGKTREVRIGEDREQMV